MPVIAGESLLYLAGNQRTGANYPGGRSRREHYIDAVRGRVVGLRSDCTGQPGAIETRTGRLWKRPVHRSSP
jgi:hypothetical protein